MEQRYLGRIEPDMDVCDINGDKVGTISRVFRNELTTTPTTSTTTMSTSAMGTPTIEPTATGAMAGQGQPMHEEFIEVKTGFLGLGKHLYVPLSVVQDVTQGGVFLSESKDALESKGWNEKPAHLEDLH